MVEYVVDAVDSNVEEAVSIDLLVSRWPVAPADELFVIRVASATRSNNPTTRRELLDTSSPLQLTHTFHAWPSDIAPY
jgi:hypothetical protein